MGEGGGGRQRDAGGNNNRGLLSIGGEPGVNSIRIGKKHLIQGTERLSKQIRGCRKIEGTPARKWLKECPRVLHAGLGGGVWLRVEELGTCVKGEMPGSVQLKLDYIAQHI